MFLIINKNIHIMKSVLFISSLCLLLTLFVAPYIFPKNNLNKHLIELVDQQHHFDYIKNIIQSGSEATFMSQTIRADINAKDDNNNTALYYSVANGLTYIAKFLLEHGADVNIRNSNNYTALIKAAKANYPDMVELLIQNGADVNIRNWNGYTALNLAIDDMNFHITTLMFGTKSDNVSKLVDEFIRNHSKIVNLLLSSNGADVDIRSGYRDQTALHLACWHGHTETVKLLLQYNATINKVFDFRGDTPLFLAMFTSRPDIIELLLANGADVNYQNSYGTSALHIAGNSGPTEIAKLLLQYNATVNARNIRGETPLTLAKKSSYGLPDDLIELLLENGAIE
jgi:ankyrin repeat protein